jgi:uncharacterized protein YndB with AHSA1/START domain
MTRGKYTPGPAAGARVLKEGERSTLVLARQFPHPPSLVWRALTDPAELREWAPFEVEGDLTAVGGMVKLTWVGTSQVLETSVTRVEPPRVLAYGDIRWELEAVGGGTRLTLWHSIDPRFVAWGAAGWHICLDVLERMLDGHPIGRLVGAEAMQFEGWQRLKEEYGKQFNS